MLVLTRRFLLGCFGSRELKVFLCVWGGGGLDVRALRLSLGSTWRLVVGFRVGYVAVLESRMLVLCIRLGVWIAGP